MLGIVDVVVSPDELDAEAERLTAKIATCSATTLQTTKEFLRYARRMEPDAAMALSREPQRRGEYLERRPVSYSRAVGTPAFVHQYSHARRAAGAVGSIADIASISPCESGTGLPKRSAVVRTWALRGR